VPETFGLVVLEAMMAGRPAIASRIGGLPDVLADGESGYLVPPGDVTALRAAIEQLVFNPTLRQRMGQAARGRAAEFSESNILPRFELLYEQLLAQGSKKESARWAPTAPELDDSRHHELA
jgi:glycosyltransferase involved in cell wall biosynthesis